jgi:hypothetical protein
MATKSFAEAEKETPDQEVSTEVAPAAQQETPATDKTVATRPEGGAVAHYVEGEDAEGEFSSRDMLWPSLKIVSKTSADAEVYGIGSWIIGSVKVGEMTKPVKVVAVKIQKAYQEQLPYGSQVRPRIFRTSADVFAAGLTLDWDTDRPRAAEVLGVRFWVPQPEGVDAPDVFVLEGPEGPGAIVKFFAARTAYGTVGKTLIHAHQTHLRADKGGLISKWWNLTATKEARNNNTWLLPRLALGEKVDEKLIAFLKDLGV